MAACYSDLCYSSLVVLRLRGSPLRVDRGGGGREIHPALHLPRRLYPLPLVLLENRVDSSRLYTYQIQVR